MGSMELPGLTAPGRPGLDPGPPGSPGSAYTSDPSAARTRTAPSSSRSRDSVAWVTGTPRSFSSRASSSCERTCRSASVAATHACRDALVLGLVSVITPARGAT